MRTAQFLLTAVVLVALAAGSSFAQGGQNSRKPALDKGLTTAGRGSDKLRVIVRYKTGASTRARARMVGKIDRITRDNRGTRALVVEMRRSRLAELCLPNADIEGCSEDARVSAGSLNTLLSQTTSTIAVPAPTPVPQPTPVTTPEPVVEEPPAYDAQSVRATLGVQIGRAHV